MTEEQGRTLGRPLAGELVEHLPLRPLWLCRRCGQPWPCGAAKVALLTEYQDNRVSLFLEQIQAFRLLAALLRQYAQTEQR
ncbi:hypothetical protein ACIBTV_20085 [Micromonospora sp. NPDC049366]|uniref:hypothetical protein n=1 Tax=Micromonospora sp. NPDC049366 TaxID=3364271 RepID=UPI00378FAF16